MKNKILIATLAAVILITLAGCGHTKAVQREETNTAGTSSASVTSDTETSDDAAAENPFPAVDSEITTEKETTVPPTESTAKVSTQDTAHPSVPLKQYTQKKQSVPSKNTDIPTVSSVQKPVQTTAQKETTTKAADPTEKPKTTKPCEPTFDINYWISYAKSYAGSVGLRLESSAVDCWDNPISANAKCKYLERDIKSRLNYYAKAEDITDVWIWAEKVADNSYEIYIGYA